MWTSLRASIRAVRKVEMFKKILIASRGEGRREARAWARPHCLRREAQAGDLTPMETTHV
jgi:hypothetical protein